MDEVVSSRICRVYDAVGNPQEWNLILDEISDSFSLHGANLFSGDSIEEELTNAWMDYHLWPVFQEWLQSDVAKTDAEISRLVLRLLPIQQFSVLNEMQGYLNQAGKAIPEGFSEVENWLKARLGTDYRCCAPLNVKPGYWDFLTFHFGSQTRNPELVINCANQLLSHIAKATLINRPFVLLEARFNAILSVLNKFHLAVFVIDESYQIVVHNDAAQRMLDDRDSLFQGRAGQLKMLDADDQLFLTNALKSQKNPSDQVLQQRALSRKGLKLSYYLEVSRLSNQLIGEPGPYWLLTLVDPERKDIVNTDGLEQVYALSRSEKAVVQSLVAGMNNKQIAESRNVSPETIKTQVKSIYNKLDCNTRTDLVSLAHKISIPVELAKTEKARVACK